MARGGKRQGAGRKPVNRQTVAIRLSESEARLLKQLGGSVWVRQKLKEVRLADPLGKVDMTKTF